MNVHCKITREIFNNPSNNFRVLACILTGEENPEIELNQYGNFTIAGSNLFNLDIDEEYDLNIREDRNAKRPASYKMVGFYGVEEGKKITVSREREYSILSKFMEDSQVHYVLDAYPDFCQMILDGRESEIDYKNIYNVGPVRYESYVNAVKSHFQAIYFLPVASEWGVEDWEQIEKLIKVYATPDDLREAFTQNPYHVYRNDLGFSFKRTDRTVLSKKPEFIDSYERCEFGCLEIFKEMEDCGDTRVDADLMKEMAAELVPESAKHLDDVVKTSKYIYYDPDTGYSSLKNTYNYEVNICNAIMDRVNAPKEDSYTPMDWHDFTSVDGFNCTEEQINFLKLICSEHVCMLRGYAGTGKSTVQKAVILMLEHYNKSYVLLAPTGKAAARLRETTGREAYTIHMYLARIEQMATPDYIIIDEASMVGVELMSRLMSNICIWTNLAFICDEAQLASISCGNVIQDLIDSGKVKMAQLTKVFRYGSSGLATIATDTRNGELGPRTTSNQFPDYKFISIDDDISNTEVLKKVLTVYEDLIDKGYKQDDILVLCPFNKTKVGTYAINNAIQAKFNTHESKTMPRVISSEDTTIEFKVGDKVINTVNNYRMETFTDCDEGLVPSDKIIPVMNGDIGYVRWVGDEDMAVQFDTGLAHITRSTVRNLLLGYCITVHKSQGSQAKAVIFISTKMHRKMLTRNLLYVADTRAQEELIEIGQDIYIEEALGVVEQNDRDTWLKDLMAEWNHENNQDYIEEEK